MPPMKEGPLKLWHGGMGSGAGVVVVVVLGDIVVVLAAGVVVMGAIVVVLGAIVVVLGAAVVGVVVSGTTVVVELGAIVVVVLVAVVVVSGGAVVVASGGGVVDFVVVVVASVIGGPFVVELSDLFDAVVITFGVISGVEVAAEFSWQLNVAKIPTNRQRRRALDDDFIFGRFRMQLLSKIIFFAVKMQPKPISKYPNPNCVKCRR